MSSLLQLVSEIDLLRTCFFAAINEVEATRSQYFQLSFFNGKIIKGSFVCLC